MDLNFVVCYCGTDASGASISLFSGIWVCPRAAPFQLCGRI